MSRKEVPRAGLVKAALTGKITNVEGARALHLSVRQFKRLKARVRAAGVGALVHRSRGQPSPRRLSADLRAHDVRSYPVPVAFVGGVLDSGCVEGRAPSAVVVGGAHDRTREGATPRTRVGHEEPSASSGLTGDLRAIPMNQTDSPCCLILMPTSPASTSCRWPA